MLYITTTFGFEIIWNKNLVLNLLIGPPFIFCLFPMENPAYTSDSKWLLTAMKNRAERIIFSSFDKAILRRGGPFYFLCVRFANNDLTRCNSSHVDAVSHLSSLRLPFPFTRLFIVSLGNERKLSKIVSRQYGCWDLGQSTSTIDALIVTSSACAAVKLKGSLCVWGVGADEGGRDVSGSGRDFDAWRPLLGHNVARTQKLLCLSAVRRVGIQK